MIVIKYSYLDGKFSYSRTSEILDMRHGDQYSSKNKAAKFVETKVLKSGLVPEEFKLIEIYELSQGFNQVKKIYYGR